MQTLVTKTKHAFMTSTTGTCACRCAVRLFWTTKVSAQAQNQVCYTHIAPDAGQQRPSCNRMLHHTCERHPGGAHTCCGKGIGGAQQWEVLECLPRPHEVAHDKDDQIERRQSPLAGIIQPPRLWNAMHNRKNKTKPYNAVGNSQNQGALNNKS